MENNLAIPQKVKDRITIWARNSTPGCIPQKTENRYSNKYIHMHVHSITIHSSQKGKTTQMSIDEWMNKQIVGYNTYNGVLFGYNKEWRTDTQWNMDEPQKHDVKWKKPDTQKNHLLYDPIYDVKYPQ